MIGSSRQLRVFAFEQPADMRNGFDGLYALVANRLKRDVLGGDLFLFVNRTRKRAKVLFWDGTGLVIYAKRLEKGRFTAPWTKGGKGPTIEMTSSELALFLEGSTLAGRVPLSPVPFVLGPLAAFTGAVNRQG
jgi:transposase